MPAYTIDLTHTLQSNITVYPGTLPASFEPGNTIEKDGFAELNIRMTTHAGTHIDAPCHILSGKRTLDAFPMDKFFGKAICIDCTGKDSIDVTFIQSFKTNIAQAEFVLFYSGWQHKWNSPQYFDPFPTLTTEAVQWLIQFDLKAVGFDYISADNMDSVLLPNHHALLGKEILIIENLTNLDKMVGKSFELFCIPLKIGKADGSPVRAFARG